MARSIAFLVLAASSMQCGGGGGSTALPAPQVLVGIRQPFNLVLDEGGDRLWILGKGEDPDPGTIHSLGASTLSVRLFLEPGPPFTSLEHTSGLAFDAPSERLLFFDSDVGGLRAFDLRTGAFELLMPLPEFLSARFPGRIEFDAGSGIALIADSRGALVAVDLSMGVTRVVSDALTGSGPLLQAPVGIALNESATLAFVTDIGTRSVVEVDIATGDRRLVATGFEFPESIVLDRARQRLLVSDPFRNQLVSIDVASGVLTILAENFMGVDDLAIDAAGRRLWALSEFGIDEFDLRTGGSRRIAVPPPP